MVHDPHAPVLVQDPVLITGNNVLYPCSHHHLYDGSPRCPRPVDHNPHIRNILPNYLQSVQKSCSHHNGCPVLVIVEHRDVQFLLQPPLHLKALWRRDILQINPSKHRRDLLHRCDDLLRVLGVQTYGKRIHPSELLKQDGLALHNRNRRLRSDIPQSEDSRAVRHHAHQVALCRVAVDSSLILKDLLARLGHPGSIGNT